jgi:hypothetical protein
MDSVLSGDRDAAIWLTQQFLLKRELDFVNQFLTTGIWTNNAAGGASATGTLGAGGSTVVYWENPSASPIEDVRNANRAIQNQQRRGCRAPGYLFLSLRVIHPSELVTLKSWMHIALRVYKAEIVQPAAIALLGRAAPERASLW